MSWMCLKLCSCDDHLESGEDLVKRGRAEQKKLLLEVGETLQLYNKIRMLVFKFMYDGVSHFQKFQAGRFPVLTCMEFTVNGLVV